MKAYTMSHIGLVRELNEDTVLVREGAHGLYILADGMGGHKAGEVASALAAQTLAERLENQLPQPGTLMQAMLSANAAVYEKQRGDDNLSGMGTTLTVLWEEDTHVLVGHVGDSRAYLFRDGRLHQMTDDHSMVGEMVRSGAITAQEARVHPYRSVITRAIGTDEAVTPDVFRTLKSPGDIWLLCSDGLNDMVEDEEIARVLAGCPLQEAAQALIDLALQGGGRDNVSVILLEVCA